MLKIVLNGEDRAIEHGTTISALVTTLGLQKEHVAVERNREIVLRADHDRRVLLEGDTLEIVTFVGGG